MPDARWGDPREYDQRNRGDEWSRVYETRDRDEYDPRDGLMRDLDLPRGDERQLVVDRDRVYELDGEDSRTLAAVEWNVIERVPCAIKMLRTPKAEAGFYEFDQFERLLEASVGDGQAHLVVLLGGEAGLRCGEMIGLEWTDIDLDKRQLCVARSEWRGHVSVPKGGRIRYVPLTKRLVAALKLVGICEVSGCSAMSRADRSRRR